MTYLIKTERLGLRPWTMDDLQPMSELNADREVMRYFPSTPTKQETKNFITRMIDHQADHGYCYFATELLDTREFIGFIGLAYQTYEAPFTPATDIGWRLKRSAWGKGYATEGAKACVEFAFNVLNLSSIYSVASEINRPSLRVMEKIGMLKLGEFDHPALTDYSELKKCVYMQLSRK